MSNVTIIDARVQKARDYLTDGMGEMEQVEQLLSDLLDYADERLKVNVGIQAENGTLKQRLNEKPGDKEITDADLIRLMQERGLLVVSQ